MFNIIHTISGVQKKKKFYGLIHQYRKISLIKCEKQQGYNSQLHKNKEDIS